MRMRDENAVDINTIIESYKVNYFIAVLAYTVGYKIHCNIHKSYIYI